MTVTVNINGLTLCHSKSSGFVKSTLPDVCYTPAVNNAPIPYINIAYSKDLTNGTRTVKADNGASCANKGSKFGKSTGNESGSGGGVKSGVNVGEASWLSWSQNVRMEGKPVCRLTDKMLLNNGNTASVGGEQQKWLGGNDPNMDQLCEFACECLEAIFMQHCLNEKIESNYYQRDFLGRQYPVSSSPFWREVSMKKRYGRWEIIKNGDNTAPTSNPYTPLGGIRPDVMLINPGPIARPYAMVEVKFPGDRLNTNQLPGGAYDEAARDLRIERIDLNVEEDCDCGQEEEQAEPAPVPVPTPLPAGPPRGYEDYTVPGPAVPGNPQPAGSWCKPIPLTFGWVYKCVQG